MEWTWKGGRVHYYHFTVHYPPPTPCSCFSSDLHHAGSEPLLHVNWSACNPHYRTRRQLYVLPFAKAHRSPHVQALWENHSCRQSMVVNLQANHTSQLFIHTVHIQSYNSSSIHLHLCITLKQNAELTPLSGLPSSIHPSLQYKVFCTCTHALSSHRGDCLH